MKLFEAINTDLNFIEQLAKSFNLDIDDLKAEEFLVAKKENRIVGFGRLKRHNGFEEISTVGVIKEERMNGVGKVILEGLIKQAKGEIYLITMIPDFFKQFDFEAINIFPEELKAKEKICKMHTCNCEDVTVMKFKK